MQLILIISVALIFITIAIAQENVPKRPKSCQNLQKRQPRRTTSGEKNTNDQILTEKLEIASLVDMENVKFGLQLKSMSEHRMKTFRKWTKDELLNHINQKTEKILKLNNLQEKLVGLLALGSTVDETVATVADHMNFEHMETTVKHALDSNYPSGMLPYWKAEVSLKAEAEAKKLIKTLVEKLQVGRSSGRSGN